MTNLPTGYFSRISFLYRLKSQGSKVSALRPLGYVIFAYGLTFRELSINSLWNIGVVGCVLVVSYILNDYFDWRVRSDRNHLAQELAHGDLTLKSVVRLVTILLVIGVGLAVMFLLGHPRAIYIIPTLLAGLFLAVGYSIPPVRLKDRFFGPLVFPLAATILFIESWMVQIPASSEMIFFSVLVFLYQSYLEILHLITDSFDQEERIRFPTRWNRPLGHLIHCIHLIFLIWLALNINLLFLIAIVLLAIRWISFIFSSDREIREKRRNIFSPLLGTYEFIFYIMMKSMLL